MYIENRLKKILFNLDLLDYKPIAEVELKDISSCKGRSLYLCLLELQVNLPIQAICILDGVVLMDVYKSHIHLYLGLLSSQDIHVYRTGPAIYTFTCKLSNYNEIWNVVEKIF